MYLLACEKPITIQQGQPVCEAWLNVDQAVLDTNLKHDDFVELYPWVLLMFVIAIGTRFLLHMMKGSRNE